jgi:hypothetical protein
MVKVVERVRPTPSFLPPVLITEDANEQREIWRALIQEIKPTNIIERMYVADIASIAFDTLRLRRSKTEITNIGFRAALQDVLTRLLREPGQDGWYVPREAENLALQWFTSKKAREEVSEILSKFGLNEAVIEGEAIRRSATDLDRLERMLNSLEVRRTRALCCVAEYRASLAHQLRETTDRIVETQTVRQLGHTSAKNWAAA